MDAGKQNGLHTSAEALPVSYKNKTAAVITIEQMTTRQK
jgi:hypothetical protein